MNTLFAANLAILAGLGALAFRLLDRASGRLAASAATAVLLGVFAFSRYLPIANYNYVAPYQHAQTHGLAFAFAMLACLVAWLRAGRRRWAAAAGACLGGVFLTKAELFVPAAATLLGGVALAAARPRGVGPGAAWLALGAALPPLVALAGLAAQMEPGLAARGVLGNWPYLGAALAEEPFYRRGAGLEDPLGNAGRMLAAFAGLLAFAALAWGADRIAPRGAGWGVLAGALVFAGLVIGAEAVPWWDLARALPLAMAAALVLLGAACLRRRRDGEAFARRATLALWALLALGLLGKMGLHARFTHYGFALAMPATLLGVALLVEGLPRALGGRAVARGIALGAVLAGVVFFLGASQRLYARQSFALGPPGDTLRVDDASRSPRGPILARTLERLGALASPGDTLLVLPEGAILNYWLRLENPARFTLFLPPELAAFGEAVVLEAVRASAPDWVALVHREHREFGVGPFGRDPRNGRALRAWVDAHYRPVERIGATPFRGRGFGVEILRRRERADAARGPHTGLR